MENDDELIQIFVEESREILEKIYHGLDIWKKAKGEKSKESLDAILRELHTLKGSARMIGLLGLSEYAHYLEQVIQKIRHHSEDFVLNEKTTKEIQRALDYLSSYIEMFCISRTTPLDPPPVVSIENEEHDLPLFTQKEGQVPPSQAQETIRVKTTLLEYFRQLTGQINISRANAEQSVKESTHMVLQMVKEIKVIQERLRQLQAKTDVAFQEDKREEKYDEFDILEMDRYSFLQIATRSLNDKLSQLEMVNGSLLRTTRQIENSLLEQRRVGNRLEEGITHVRLISIESFVPRLKRIVSQVSQELEKEVRLECMRVEGEVDKETLEKLISPLEHMIRNAIDHGIEMPQVRRERGKPPYGVITLSLFREGNQMVIQLGDDGQGIDSEQVRLKAIEKGLWRADIPLSEEDMGQIICLPGFSTKEVVTPISGRGIGLDVVNAQVNKLGGGLRISTKKYVGTQCFIRLPFTLSLSQSLVFTLGERLYALQLSSLVGLSRIMTTHEGDKIQYAKKTYELFYLSKILGEHPTDFQSEQSRPVIFLSQPRPVGFIVDKLIGSHELKIKPIGQQLNALSEIAGVSLLGNNQIVLILDPSSLMNKLSKFSLYKQETKQAKRKILIVDDSATVRQVTTRLLRRHQFEALTAKDGVEALESFKKECPDLVLLDIEMPNMDGFEVVKRMRSEPHYQHIPIIMITSRAGEKHRARAMEMGATAYLSKPYLGEELLALLRQLLP